MVIRGNPSNDFHPYMPLSKSIVGSSRDKLLVNFDPTACFLRDLKVKLKFLSFGFIKISIQNSNAICVQCAFPMTFKLWHDSIGGDAIGLTWENPKVFF